MASVLQDAPSTAATQQRPSAEAPAGAVPQAAYGSAPANTPASQPPPNDGACARCGASMASGQDWCLQCGAATHGSTSSPSWRSAAAILIATLILALGAAAAAYAALSKRTPSPHTVTTTVAQLAPPTATTPATPTTPTTPAPITKAGEIPGTGKALPLPKIKTPKIPLFPTVTPTSTAPATKTNANTTPAETTPAQTTPNSGEAGAEPTAIVLDTNAASTYNPYNYSAGDFGDPSLTIDGDTSTAWSAQVEPAIAPKMAVGVLVDLKAQQKIGSIELVSSTPGMTVQVYGTAAHTAPNSIIAPAWIALNGPRTTKKKNVKMKLRDSGKEFYYVLLWISEAPATSTAATPGHVSVNELSLFPPAG